MYLKSVEKNNITYSVDMLRLRTDITYEKYTEIEFRFKTVWQEYISKYYISNKISQFKYNYSIEIEEGKNFWFGFLHNSEAYSTSDSANYNLTVEFNPNKIQDSKFVTYLLNCSRDWCIKSVDVAFDVPVSILDICYDKMRKREIKIISNGFDNKTIYIGKCDGRIKIYNKKIESDLDITGELTRIEVSYDLNNFPTRRLTGYKFKGVLPELYTNDFLYTFETYKDKTLFAILYAVQSGFDISYLSRSYKQKLKSMIKGSHQLKLDKDCVQHVIRQTVVYYAVKANIMV